MLMTEQELRKVIQESILIHNEKIEKSLFVAEAKNSSILVTSGFGTRYHRAQLGTLLEKREYGLISEAKMWKTWEHSILIESQLLINEGVFDLAKKGFQAVSSAATGAFDKMKEVGTDIAKSMKSVVDFGVKTAKQAVSMVKDTFESCVAGYKSLRKVAAKFKEAHPFIYFVLKALIMMLLMKAAMLLIFPAIKASLATTGAALKGAIGKSALWKSFVAKSGSISGKLGGTITKAGKPISKTKLDGIRGAMEETYSHLSETLQTMKGAGADPGKLQQAQEALTKQKEAIEVFKQAAESSDNIPLSRLQNLSDPIDGAYKLFLRAVDNVKVYKDVVIKSGGLEKAPSAQVKNYFDAFDRAKEFINIGKMFRLGGG